MKKFGIVVISALIFVSRCPSASAHTLSNSYLSVVVQEKTVAGQLDIAVRDLEYAIGLDNNDDGVITWGELRAQREQISTYALSRLSLTLGGVACPLRVEKFQLDYHSDGAYAVLLFSGLAVGTVPEKAPLSVHYGVLFDIDPQHRGLLNLSFREQTELRSSTGYDSARGLIQAMLAGQKASAIFSPDHRDQTFSRELPNAVAQISQFFRNGVWHIWSGYDHIAFLLVLLLPAVLSFRKNQWEPIHGFWPILMNTVKIVTAFSLAHSITLTLAALNVVNLPSRLVESTIAGSIVWGALNNWNPRFISRTWIIAFCFGLMHGFGFASALQEFGLSRGTMLRALVSFNLGVEVGQLAIVLCFLPLAYALRRSKFYRSGVLRFGSAAIGVLGLIWFLERAFNVSLI